MSEIVEKAKAAYTRKPITDDEIELALAWLKGEIGVTQYAMALGTTPQALGIYRISSALREAYHRGLINVEEV